MWNLKTSETTNWSYLSWTLSQFNSRDFFTQVLDILSSYRQNLMQLFCIVWIFNLSFFERFGNRHCIYTDIFVLCLVITFFTKKKLNVFIIKPCNYFFFRFINPINIFSTGFRYMIWHQHKNLLSSFWILLENFLGFLNC